MKKNNYQKPTMQVIKIQHQSHLLSGTCGVESMRSGYGEAQEYEWD